MARQKALANSNHDKVLDGVQKMCEDIAEAPFIIGECLKKCVFVIGNGQELTQYKWDVSLEEEFKKFITSSSISYIVYLAKKIHNCCFEITFKDLKIDNFNKDYTFNVHFKDLRVVRYKGKAILYFEKFFFDNS